MPPVEPTSSMADALPRSSSSLAHDVEREETQKKKDDAEEEEEPPPTRRPPPPPDEAVGPSVPAALTLDHQQRWFTGWGDDPTQGSLKTPSLGLIWTTQTACRIALYKAPRYGRSRYAEEEGGGAMIKTWRRWSKIVFAPHVEESGPGLEGATEFEINMGGLKGIMRGSKK
ncbi:hypothetical protein M406DRAFT_101639 [Cryphonectria parasitica EP155]|uniref:Uncharacterized protein n=1 Tax=Cryphonectria parasitica (strain ATCC 38755 / EP155) TaxID=660469 RepID=A0A9P4Y4F2_CRYP1|nr:uncharacterized protein M406DRAFT_101639 [Cryphonectria parasitica EP155]KAF3766285.1 hypothetical protein M406DRAFT_101639 [Cryphonectria parasitica EP155]